MSAENTLPPTHRALVQAKYAEHLSVQVLPTPQPGPGNAVVKVIYSSVISYIGEIYDGTRKYQYPTPLTVGSAAIERIAATGPDTTLLKPGQLVLVDVTIRGRDDPTAIFLSAFTEGATEGSKKLMRGEWRDGTAAEYVKFPLENLFPLDEAKLFRPVSEGGLGLIIEDLMNTMRLLVPYGGLADIGLHPGDTVIIAPATGGFGGAAFTVALAMGAGRIIAMGRNRDSLEAVAASHPRVVTVPMTGDAEEEVKALSAYGPIDVFFDISPPAAAKSTHFKSAMLSLRHSGRVSLMGGLRGDMTIPARKVMHENLQIRGKWMYERSDILSLLKMIETGILDPRSGPGSNCVGIFKLEDWQAAFKLASESTSTGFVVFEP